MSLNVEGICENTRIGEMKGEMKKTTGKFEEVVFESRENNLNYEKVFDIDPHELYQKERLAELPENKTIVFVCRSGGRSARAAHLSIENGFKNVFNLKGGMILWNELHYNTEA